MAVTSGKDTGKNMGGGALGGPSGGPGGGSLSAPNRTAPSSGAGGQRGSGGSGGSGLRGAGSNTGAGSGRPGSDSSSKTSSSASSSKSSTSSASKSTGPDRGPTSSPARTAPSAGITSGRSAAQQKSVDKAKQSYSQYGGAQTSMRNATAAKSAPSAKVQDPSRGLVGPKSPMSGQGTSYKSPQAAAIGNKLSGNVIDQRGMNNYPNDPLSEMDNRIGKLDSKLRDEMESYRRGTAAAIAGPQRTPQEISFNAQRYKDIGNAAAKRAYEKDALSNLNRDRMGKPGFTNTAGSQLAKDVASALANPQAPRQSLTGDRLFAAGVTKPSAPSVKTYDPLSSIRAPQGPIAQDPSIAGRAALADKNYKTTSMGGNVSRTYEDPDVPSLGQRYTDSILGGIKSAASSVGSGLSSVGSGIQSAADSIAGMINGAPPAGLDPSILGRAQASKNVAQRVGDVMGAAYNNATSAAGSFIDGLMGSSPGIANTGSFPSRGLVGPGYSLSKAEGSLPGRVMDDPNQTSAAKQTKEITDRVPQEPDITSPLYGNDIRRRQAGEQLNQQHGSLAAGSYPDAATMMGIAPSQAQPSMIGGGGLVAASNIANPDVVTKGMIGTNVRNADLASYGNLSGFSDRVANPANQVTASNMNGPLADAMDEARARRAQAIADARKAPSAPMALNKTPGDPLLAGVGALDGSIKARTAAAQQAVMQQIAELQAVNSVNKQKARGLGDDLPAPQLGPDVVTGPQPSAPATDSPLAAPSQQGSYPPDANFTQNAGQPQSLSELKNRATYEKDQAIKGFKEAPGKILDALIAGDFRKYNGTTNDKRSDIKQRRQMAQQALQGLSTDQQAALITQLMVLLQQTSGNASQAALVNNTFV